MWLVLPLGEQDLADYAVISLEQQGELEALGLPGVLAAELPGLASSLGRVLLCPHPLGPPFVISASG